MSNVDTGRYTPRFAARSAFGWHYRRTKRTVVWVAVDNKPMLFLCAPSGVASKGTLFAGSFLGAARKLSAASLFGSGVLHRNSEDRCERREAALSALCVVRRGVLTFAR